MQIIPAIDMKDGRCVRLFQGEFDRQTAYSDNPVAVARDFEAHGLGRLHIVDLDGAQTGDQRNQDIVRRIVVETGFTIQLGGGIRDVSSVESWLEAGISRCVIGSMAVTQANTVQQWLSDFGPDRIVLALDVRIDDNGMPALATHGWTRTSGTSLWDCVDDYLDAGLKHVLCTDIRRDGAMSGPAAELYRQFTNRYPEVDLQASGGVRHIGDIEALRETGAAAAITGRALLDGRISKEEIASFLRAA